MTAKRKLGSKEAVKCAIPSLLFHNSGTGHAVGKYICLGNSLVLLFISTTAANTKTQYPSTEHKNANVQSQGSGEKQGKP